MNKISTERAIEILYTIRGYYASLTAGYPKGRDCKGIDDVTCSEIANSCLMAIKALKQQYESIPIPVKAINGDMIKAMFPMAKWWVTEDNEVFTDASWGERIYFNLDWWNTSYKAENED